MKPNWRIEAPQLLAIVLMFALAAWAWPRVPERVPIHWNLQGEVDRYGSKFFGLMMLPLAVLGIYVLLLAAPLIDPGRRNYRNFAPAYGIIRLTIVLFTAAVQIVMVLAALGRQVDVALVVALGVGAMFLVLGNLMGKIRPNWFVGVRTPWTLSSRLSWNKTHRLAGWLFIVMGLAIALTGLLRTPWMLAIMIAVNALCLVWMVAYSYVVYRNDPERLSPAGVAPAEE